MFHPSMMSSLCTSTAQAILTDRSSSASDGSRHKLSKVAVELRIRNKKTKRGRNGGGENGKKRGHFSEGQE